MKKNVFASVLAVVLIIAIFVLPIINTKTSSNNTNKIDKSASVITEKSSDESLKTSEQTVKNDNTVTFIVIVDGDSLLDTVICSNGKYKNVSELILSSDAKTFYDIIKKNQAVIKASIQKTIPKSDFSGCYTYTSAINGFTVKAPYSYMDKISKINGVKSVAVSSSSYTDSENSVSKLSSVSKNALGMQYAYKSGYTGQNVLIAVIDDAFDVSHSAFSTPVSQVKCTENILNKIYDTVGFNTDKKYTSDDLSVNSKIVFAYDYADNDNNTYCVDKNHGTGVAGIAAGNNGKKDSSAFLGTAYNAQLAFMKVCSDNADYYSDDAVIAALDDAAKIGADIINCSYGSAKSQSNSQLFNSIYEKLFKSGIYIVSAAGNNSFNGSASGISKVSSSYVDYGTIGFPAGFNESLTVGGVNSDKYISNYFLADKKEIAYSEIVLSNTIDENNTEKPKNTKIFSDAIKNNTEYIYIDSYGEQNDYSDIDVKGKTVIVNRGKNTFENKIKIAYKNGAVGIVIINFDDTDITGETVNKYIPAVIVNSLYREYFLENPEGTIVPQKNYTLFDNSDKGKIYSGSSYGVTADLHLKPEITAPATDIYSSSNNDSYKSYSGTSMSASCVSGAVALFKQYINSNSALSSMSVSKQNEYISSLLMSTADIIEYPDNNESNDDRLYYTPRIQGAGRLNVQKAVASKSYITVNGSEKPKAELGDNSDGVYKFNFVIHNNSDKNIKYNLSSIIQTDKPAISDDGKIYNTLSPLSISDYADIVMTANGKAVKSVTVKASESTEISVSITLKPQMLLSYKKYFPNGFFVDGYILLNSSDKSTVNLNFPFMGFCGDWSGNNIFDNTIYDNKSSITGFDNSLVAVDTANYDADCYVLGKNIFNGETDKKNILISDDTMKNIQDKSSAGKPMIVPNFYLLRDASNYTVTVYDKSGKSLFSENFGNVSSYISSDESPYKQFLKNYNTDGLNNFFSSLSNGTYIYTVSASSKAFDGKEEKLSSISYDFTVNNQKLNVSDSKTYLNNDRIYLEISAKESDLIQGFKFYTASYNENKKSYDYADSIDSLIEHEYISKDAYEFKEIKKSNDGRVTFVYDITNLNSEIKRLGILSTKDNTVPSPVKIVYRAVDYAYNYSAAKTADTVLYGTVTFKFTDQNGKGVKDIVISMNGKEQTSSDDGKIVFEKVMTDLYAAVVTSVPENYKVSKKCFMFNVSNSELEIVNNVAVQYSGNENVVSELSENSNSNLSEQENSSGTSNVSSHTGSSNTYDYDSENERNTDINSVYAIFFVSTLLAISIAALFVSKQRTKR